MPIKFFQVPDTIGTAQNVAAQTMMDPTGKYRLYVGQMQNGVKHGQGTEFYPNGKPKYTGNYLNDMQEDAQATFFYETGQTMYTGGVSQSM